MKLKTADQIKKMRDAGLLLWETHQRAMQLLTPGITTAEIDREVENFIRRNKAIPLFKGVPGKVPFPASACTSINEAVVHGIPSERKLFDGDIIGIDIGVQLNGWCADAAVTHAIGTNSNRRVMDLLLVTEQCLRMDISLLEQKSKWSKVVKKRAKYVHDAGFSIVDALEGHAIGTEMWELPGVPNIVPSPDKDFKIRPGLVLAIEPMINLGKKSVEVLDDGWTYVTGDRLPSAHFEHTVAVTDHGTEVLTCGPNGEGWAC